MHSIQAKATALMVAAITVCVLLVGGESIFSIKREGDQSSAEAMRLICDNSRRSIDSYLDSIEQSVDLVTRFALDELDLVTLAEGGVIGAQGKNSREDGFRDTEGQRALDEYLAGYSDKVEALFQSVANHTNGALAFYYRINPEISTAEKGFFYSRSEGSAFNDVALTDIGAYDPKDIEHVGWYFLPIERGRPSWIAPYENKNLGVRMISYVAPLYKAGTFIGVIGMDISYETLVGQIRDLHIYDTGIAYLAEADGTILCHPWLEQGINLAEYDPMMRDGVAALSEADSNVTPIRYTLNGQKKQMMFATLSSGWKLIVAAPVSEINAPWLHLIRGVALTSVLILFLFSELTYILLRRVTDPLRKLTKASQDIAAGNYNVQLDCTGRDEVAILTGAFQRLVEHLKVYISDLNSKAYRDAMTGVLNKGAFTIATQKLSDALALSTADHPAEFGFIMLDCNDLKLINDTYGHEKGDHYLKTACKAICDVFRHSPVFRVGGDEFTVLLRGEDYADRDRLLREFDERAAERNAKTSEHWERIHIAKGLAVYEPSLDSGTESVLTRADQLMYADKKHLKAGRDVR